MNPEILNTTQARSSSLRAGRGWLLAYDATSALKCLCHAMCWLCGWCSVDGVAATFAAAARPAAETDPMTTGCWSAATRSWQEWSDLRRKKKNLTFFRALWNLFYFRPCSALFFSPQNKSHIYTHTLEHHHCRSRDGSPLGLELMVRTLLMSLLSFLKLKLAIKERRVTFPTRLVESVQSQCTVPDGQSEQTVFVRRRDFVGNEVFERGGA